MGKDEEKLNSAASPAEADTSVGTAEDVEAVMKKYDRESNTRIWEGTPKLLVRGLAIAFLTWALSWKNTSPYLTKALTFLYLILISLITAFASSMIGGAVEATQRILFDNQVYVNPVRSFIMAFLGEKTGLYIACMFARIPITVLDRLISTFFGFIVYQLVRWFEIHHE